MLKKGLSFVLVWALLLCTFVILPVPFSAAETEIAQEAADLDAADEGAEAEITDEGAEFEISDEGSGYDSSGRYVFEQFPKKTLNVGDSYSETGTVTDGSDISFEQAFYEVTDNSANAVSISLKDVSSKNSSAHSYKFTIKAERPGTAVVGYCMDWYDRAERLHFRDRTRFTVTVTGSPTNLSTPKITGFESVDSGVKITWGAVSGAARYRVYYKGSNGWTKMGSTTSNSFVDTDVKSGATYRYTVRCVNAADTAFTSGYDSTGWTYTYNMSTPKITSFSSSSSGVRIYWNAVTNAKKYRVYYKGSKGWTKMADTTSTSYLDTDVRWGSAYTYTVRCIKSDSSRFTSSYNSSGWKHTHYLSTPSISSFSSTASGVKISWGSVSGAAKYRVYYKGSKGWTKMGDTTSTSFVDTDVRKGSTYRYTVRCLNSSGSAFTSGYNSTGWTYTYSPSLATPKITKCETVSNGIRISWGAVSGATRYAVYYKGSSGWKRMAETTNTSYLDTDVRYGNSYTYTVRCLTSDGKDFASSYDSAGTKARFFSTPKLTNAYMSGGNLYVTITDTHDAASYKVWTKNSLGTTYIGEVSAKSGRISVGSTSYYDSENQTLVVDSKLKAGSAYTFIVQGYDASGESCSYYDEAGFRFTV